MIWDVAAGTLLKTIKSPYGYVLSLSYSPDGKRLAAAREDLVVMILEGVDVMP